MFYSTSPLLYLCGFACIAVAVGSFTPIAGYEPRYDVSEHLNLDLDVQDMVNFLGEYEFEDAVGTYSTGGNSVRTDDAMNVRTLEGFSNNNGKLEGEKWYNIFVAYWASTALFKDSDVYNDSQAYAHQLTISACEGIGLFAESETPVISEVSRSEGCKKGTAYMNVWMYIIHEMEAAIEDCELDFFTGKHWDEAVAFYTGSLVGADAADSIGVMPFALAEKRCTNFGTCIGNDDDIYQSQVNSNIFQLFTAGRDYYESNLANKCALMEETKESIVAQMAIPLLQGTLRYLYLADSTKEEKSRAELWVFAAAVLPVIHQYDPSVAQTLYTNALLTNEDPVPDGYAEVKYELESVYANMGISCADVGGLVSTTFESGYYPGMAPCTDDASSGGGDSGSSSSGGKKKNDDDDKGLPTWGIALIVLFVVLAVAACVIAGVYYGVKVGEKSGNIRLDEAENAMQTAV